MISFVNSSSTNSQPRLSRGFTMPEILVGIIATLILMAGAYMVMSRSFKTTSEKDSERRLEQKAQIVKQSLLRELQQIGINPRHAPFRLDPFNALVASDVPLIPFYRDCSTASFPLFDVTESVKSQLCFGITDARYYKLEYTTDTNGNGRVNNPEARAIILKGASYFDPMSQLDGAPPPLLANVDMTNMSPTDPIIYETSPGVPEIANLNSIPRLCSLQSGRKFTDVYDLVVRSYDPSSTTKNYSLIASNVLCFAAAYFRPYADFEACLNCQDVGGTVAKPQDCNAGFSNVPIANPLPYGYFLGQQPILDANEARQGMVFMKYATPATALIADEAYNTMMVKLSVILEDDKITPGKINPLTDRPYATKQIDITYYIDPANRPCYAQQGSCLFNNAQCVP